MRDVHFGNFKIFSRSKVSQYIVVDNYSIVMVSFIRIQHAQHTIVVTQRKIVVVVVVPFFIFMEQVFFVLNFVLGSKIVSKSKE